MTYEEASTWCLRNAVGLQSGHDPMGGPTLTISAFGHTVTAAVHDPSWEGWRTTLVLLVEHLKRRVAA